MKVIQITLILSILLLAGCTVEVNNNSSITKIVPNSVNDLEVCEIDSLIPSTISFKEGLDIDGNYWFVYGVNNWTDGSRITQTDYLKIREKNGLYYTNGTLTYNDLIIDSLVFEKISDSLEICEGIEIYDFSLVEYEC